MSQPSASPTLQSVTPHLTLSNSLQAIAFYEKAFGAVLLHRTAGPGGSTMHAKIAIGDSVLMMVDENPEWGLKSPLTLGGNTSALHLLVADCDSAFERAVAAGCTVLYAPTDVFWGDRFAKVADPFGHHWSIASPFEKLSLEELERRAVAARQEMEQSPAGGCSEPSATSEPSACAEPRSEAPLLVYNEEDLERPVGGCCGWVAT